MVMSTITLTAKNIVSNDTDNRVSGQDDIKDNKYQIDGTNNNNANIIDNKNTSMIKKNDNCDNNEHRNIANGNHLDTDDDNNITFGSNNKDRVLITFSTYVDNKQCKLTVAPYVLSKINSPLCF